MSKSLNNPPPKKVTKKNLTEWLNVELKRYHDDYEVKEIYTTGFGRMTKGDWTNKTTIILQNKKHHLLICIVDCIWFIGEMNAEIKRGGQLQLRNKGRVFGNRMTMNDLELVVAFPSAQKHKGPPR